MTFHAGDTFQLSVGNEPLHLWIIISDPAVDPQSLVIVNLTTDREWEDHTCCLGPGDHPFITHETVVSYSDAKIISASNLERKVNSQNAIPDSPVTEELLVRIRAGARTTLRITRGIRRFLDVQRVLP